MWEGRFSFWYKGITGISPPAIHGKDSIKGASSLSTHGGEGTDDFSTITINLPHNALVSHIRGRLVLETLEYTQELRDEILYKCSQSKVEYHIMPLEFRFSLKIDS